MLNIEYNYFSLIVYLFNLKLNTYFCMTSVQFSFLKHTLVDTLVQILWLPTCFPIVFLLNVPSFLELIVRVYCSLTRYCRYVFTIIQDLQCIYYVRALFKYFTYVKSQIPTTTLWGGCYLLWPFHRWINWDVGRWVSCPRLSAVINFRYPCKG